MEKIILIIEKGADKHLWGRVTLGDDLIVTSAGSLESLQKKMKKNLQDFHDKSAAAIEFELVHDLTAVFSEKPYLNLSVLAQKLGINRSLMAQYASGNKFPSRARAKAIEDAIHDLGRDLLQIRIAVNGEILRQLQKKQKKPRQKA